MRALARAWGSEGVVGAKKNNLPAIVGGLFKREKKKGSAEPNLVGKIKRILISLHKDHNLGGRGEFAFGGKELISRTRKKGQHLQKGQNKAKKNVGVLVKKNTSLKKGGGGA